MRVDGAHVEDAQDGRSGRPWDGAGWMVPVPARRQKPLEFRDVLAKNYNLGRDG